MTMSEISHNIPKGWLDCSPFGSLIDGLFLPMKTPLSDHIQVPPGYEFTVRTLFEQMRQLNIDVGLIVNLTNTTRYYDGDQIVHEYGVAFKRIPCRGNKEPPDYPQRNEFARVCSEFALREPGKVIAVHCTHGLNRTGFMICSYLSSKRGWPLDAAIKEFADKRPPGILRLEHLRELSQQFRVAVPLGWLECPPLGDVIDGLFLPLKTPLGEHVQVPPGHEFTVRTFFEQIRRKNIDVGLIVDLTSTSSYYDGDRVVEEYGIDLKRIPCRSMDKGPPGQVERSEFMTVCQEFTVNNPGKVIAVHCTHGLDQTGFMICAFLSSKRNWVTETAIDEFAAKRPPGILRPGHKKELSCSYSSWR